MAGPSPVGTARACLTTEPVSAGREFDARKPSLDAEGDRPSIGCSSNGQACLCLAAWHPLEVAEGGSAEGGQRFTMFGQ